MFKIDRSRPWPPDIDLATVRGTLRYMEDDMRRVPQFAKIAAALEDAIREIDDLSLSSATCRVAGYLLTQAGSGGGTFDLKVPKQTLASRLSVQPETFSRIVRQLRNQALDSVRETIVAGYGDGLPLDLQTVSVWD